jgi:hypothetical protein
VDFCADFKAAVSIGFYRGGELGEEIVAQFEQGETVETVPKLREP